MALMNRGSDILPMDYPPFPTIAELESAGALMDISGIQELEAKGKAQKLDAERPRMDLLDPDFLVGVSKVLGFGAQKYAAHNWRLGLDASRTYAALLRHLTSFWNGEDLDPESGLPHLYHAACMLMFLAWTIEHKPEHDDRWKAE